MPRRSLAGRIEVNCEPEWKALVERAARQTGRSASSYLRVAVHLQMRADGFGEELDDVLRQIENRLAKEGRTTQADGAVKRKAKPRKQREPRS